MTFFKHLPAEGIEQAALQTLRNDVTTYLATEVLLHYTDHGIGHSDRMVDIISDLIQPIQESTTGLRVAELTALYAACYLHDLGMHVEKLGGLKSVPQDWDTLQKPARENITRDKHHAISAELVVMAAQKSGPCSALHLKELHPDQIACLCEAHNLWLEQPDDATRYTELTQDTGGMRMGFLAALLRLADVLDESQERAGIDKARILDLDKDSLKHWWRHYYTEHISFSEPTRTLTIEFKFPKDKAEEYAGIIPELQYPYIAAEVQRHSAVLTKNNCNWQISKTISSTPYSTKVEMPHDVELSMLADLQHRREQREAQERIAALADFREARPAITRAIKLLTDQKPKISPVEYIDKALALHRRLWLAGGKRSAFGSFESIFRGEKDLLPPEIRLDCACQLSSWRRECGGLAFVSAQELNSLQSQADHLEEKTPLRFKYYRELFRSLYDTGINYQEACTAAKTALSATSTDCEKLETVADLAEMSYLLAEPAEAFAVLKEHEELYRLVKSSEALRCQLLRWRLLAMQGQGTDVIVEVNAFINGFSDWNGNSDVIRCLLLKAEILRLMGDLPAATTVFSDELWLNAKSLPPSESVVVANCYQEVAMNSFEKNPLIEWTAHVDERKTVGFEFEDAGHALSGFDSAAEGRHYDAMASFLIAVRNMYRRGGWSALHNAFGRLALETVAVGSVHDAAFYCMLGSSTEHKQAVAKALINCNNIDELLRAIKTLLAFAHLPLHARTACEILESLGDEIPDIIMPNVVRYLMECTDFRAKGGFSTTEASEAAWVALAALANRIDISVAREVADKILAANLPTQNILLRRKLTRVLIRMLPKLEGAQISPLAEATVSILTDHKHDVDFREALNLLAEIATYASDDVKDRIRKRIFPDGKCNGNGLLLQISNLFNVIPSLEELRSMCQRILQRLDSEVVVLDIDAEVPKHGCSSFSRVVDGKQVVTYEIPMAVLWGLIRHINRVESQTISALLNALLANLANSEDSVSNKCTILDVLPCFLIACDDSERKKAIRIIADIASAEPVAPSGMQTAEEANHPLQRFRMHTGSPEQVRGRAIQSLTKIAKDHPEDCPSGELQTILEAGVASNVEDIRKASFWAAQSTVKLSDRTLMQMLIGTRDESPIAAASALYVFANNSLIPLAQFAELLCYTLRYAVRSDAKPLRLASAKLLNRLEQEKLEPAVAEEVSSLASILRQDRSWSVRQAIDLKKREAEIDVVC